MSTQSVRIPSDIRSLADKWDGYWAAVSPGKQGLGIRHYDNGEAFAMFTSSGPGDYYLWSSKRQIRLRSWTRAKDMWDHAREILKQGPGRYGLVQMMSVMYDT